MVPCNFRVIYQRGFQVLSYVTVTERKYFTFPIRHAGSGVGTSSAGDIHDHARNGWHIPSMVHLSPFYEYCFEITTI